MAKAALEPLFKLPGAETNYLVLSANRSDALVTLSGALSVDPDGDSLTFTWVEEGDPVPLAQGMFATNRFELGEHVVRLLVADAAATSIDVLRFEVITPGDAVEELIAFITDANLPRTKKRPLIASLQAAASSLEEGRSGHAIRQLEAFQMKVRSQLSNSHPEWAAPLLEATGQILDALALKPPGKGKEEDSHGGGTNG